MTADGLTAYDRYDRAVQLLARDEVQQLSPAASMTESTLISARRRYFDEVVPADPVGQMLRLDFHTSLVDSLLLLTDKMSMATSLEARVPLLDHELVEAVTALPSSSKIKGRNLRFIQKKSMEGRLPDSVLRKKKRGFGCPVGAWFRSDLRPLLLDTLAAPVLKRHGLLNAEKVQGVIAEHEKCREDRTDLLLALLTFQLWYDQWKVA
jgi:asparagine synthase (glutamine-hydrolysing)